MNRPGVSQVVYLAAVSALGAVAFLGLGDHVLRVLSSIPRTVLMVSCTGLPALGARFLICGFLTTGVASPGVLAATGAGSVGAVVNVVGIVIANLVITQVQTMFFPMAVA